MLKYFLLFGYIATQCPSNSADFGTDTIIGSASGIISAEIDGEYPNNLECSWNIGVPGRNITLVLEYINIEYANNCIYDSLTIIETSGFHDEFYCDYNNSYIYLDLFGEVNIVFTSDTSQGTQEDTEPAGFVISYEVYDPCVPNPCENGGLCNEGQCTCSDRYRGDYCEIEKDFCELFTCIHGEVSKSGF